MGKVRLADSGEEVKIRRGAEDIRQEAEGLRQLEERMGDSFVVVNLQEFAAEHGMTPQELLDRLAWAVENGLLDLEFLETVKCLFPDLEPRPLRLSEDA